MVPTTLFKTPFDFLHYTEYTSIEATAGVRWMQIAQDREEWRQMEEAYVQQWQFRAEGECRVSLDHCAMISFITSLRALSRNISQEPHIDTYEELKRAGIDRDSPVAAHQLQGL